MKHKTVIITTLNDAWAEPGSIFDLFLESFHIGGNQTQKLLNHLVVITWDQKAHARCLALHKHCYQLETKGDNFTSEAFFMTPDYLHMMWRRIEFLGSVLHLGYSFVFTDTDIMWLRDPFKQFYKDADFQIACDFFNGNSHDLHNLPNGGFNYVKSNARTIWFYKFWFNSRKDYPDMHDQDVLNKIKMDPLVSQKKMKIRFLSTDNKVNDLRMLLEDWKKYMALSKDQKKKSHPSWRVPESCRTSFQRSREKKQTKGRL
ncbi:Nucleotide-diphospho-sugar transferase [Sesbania bispinosa]|nr:Nucleotide-diphospho-sugar transferase [Sesbania bispinosa]